MKKIILAAVILIGCSNGRNQLMTELLTKKKALDDSISLYKNYETFYLNKIVETQDSTLVKKYQDSAVNASIRKDELKKELPAVTFSIDSLQNMK